MSSGAGKNLIAWPYVSARHVHIAPILAALFGIMPMQSDDGNIPHRRRHVVFLSGRTPIAK